MLSGELRRLAGDVEEVAVAALDFPRLVAELGQRFPALGEELIRRQSLAIDGVLIHRPMLEKFRPDSQLVFVARIAGG